MDRASESQSWNKGHTVQLFHLLDNKVKSQRMLSDFPQVKEQISDGSELEC